MWTSLLASWLISVRLCMYYCAWECHASILGECGALWGERERVVWSICAVKYSFQIKLFFTKWMFTQVMKLSSGWTVVYTRHKMYRNETYLAFGVTHPSSDCIVQNLRVTHMEGVLVHHVCMVACTGAWGLASGNYACCTYNAKVKQRVEKWSDITCCCTQIIFQFAEG